MKLALTICIIALLLASASPAPQQQCPSLCEPDLAPVCARFRNKMQTFNNICIMKAFNCDTKQYFYKVRDGNC